MQFRDTKLSKVNESPKRDAPSKRDSLTSLLSDLIHDPRGFVLIFAVGTGVATIICLYFGLSLALSLLGGIVALGFAIALSSLCHPD